MSKTIALFDVDGTLTVPRKVRGVFLDAKEREMKARRLPIDNQSMALPRFPFSSRYSHSLRHSITFPTTQTADAKTLDFLQELRKVRENRERGQRWRKRERQRKASPVGSAAEKTDQCSTLFRFLFPCSHQTTINHSQHVKVGIVGGSDLVKISEQLGENSE